jgi:hypothetical protein
MPDRVDIDTLRITFRDASGHEERARGIAQQAAALLADLIAERPISFGVPPSAQHRAPAEVPLDLGTVSNAAAARRIAEAAYEAATSAERRRPAEPPTGSKSRNGRDPRSSEMPSLRS